MKKKMHVWKYYAAAFVIPVIVACIVFAIYGITPFGNHNLLLSDLLTQYMPFFKLLRDQMLHHTLSSYSFLVSIGDNTVPIYTYYLMSPLNLLVSWFSVIHLPILISIIILIKIGLIGWSMAFFLKVKYQRQDMMQIMAAVAYSLCGYVALYFYDFMWLEALMILPLLTLGIERLFYKGKWGGYVVALTAIIIMNYYMGYMLCIYSVIYFVYLVFLNRPIKTGFWHYLKVHGSMTCKYVISSIIAALLSGFMLIPSIVGMLSTSKGLFKIWDFIPYPRFSPAVFANLGVGANNFMGRLSHDPSIFVGTIFIMGLLVFWFSKKISKRQKHASFWLVGAIFLGMWITTFNTIWHMFQNPAGFPYREAFMFGFVMIMFAYEAYINGAFKNNRVVITAGSIVAALLVIGYICADIIIFFNHMQQVNNQLIVSNTHLLIAIVFVALTTGLLVAANRYGKKIWYLIFAVLCVEMGVNLYLSLQGELVNGVRQSASFGNQKRFENAYNQSKGIIDRKIDNKKDQTTFHRNDVDNQIYSHIINQAYNQYNDSIIFNFRGVSGYSSTLNMHTQDVLSKLGLSSRNVRRVSVIGSSPVTDQLLGITNHLTILPNGQAVNKKDNRFSGLGYAVSDQIVKTKLKKNHVFINLNKFVQHEAGTKKKYMHRAQVTVNSSNKRHYKMPSSYNTKLMDQIDGYEYHLTINPTITGNQYMYLANANLYNDQIFVNGKPLPNRYKMLGTENVYLGHFKRGEKYTVKLVVTDAIKEKSLLRSFSGLDNAAFNKFVDETQPYKLQIDHPENPKLSGSDFTGHVKTTPKRNVLMLSIPYDKGWHVTENGKKVKTLMVGDGMTGLKLKPGKHTLHFHYRTPGLILGLILTLVGIIGAFSEWFFYRKRNK
ncbi:YfhO family protein [Fructilactobacillus fructivorans]|uniref:YfhO family protein n=1 Tax=Fructilactobacillus fructivorans TaxID=1614 RepID=UPI00070C5579|nr:YfhO family protein [Fructilactobacillus fructivorans]KRN40872.1 hypothetical protein IV51_GL001099 [Fructilactobacillus fructivorans]